MSSFRGGDADRFRSQMEQVARALTQQADAVGKGAQSLRKYADELERLKLR